MIIVFVLVACSNRDNVDIPLSDDKPTLFVLCNNTDVSCAEMSISVSPYLVQQYGEGVISEIYYSIDSSTGASIFEQLELSTIPSYLIFDSNQIEVFRHTGDIELNQLDEVFSQLLSG